MGQATPRPALPNKSEGRGRSRAAAAAAHRRGREASAPSRSVCNRVRPPEGGRNRGVLILLPCFFIIGGSRTCSGYMKGNSKNARAPWAPQRMKVALPVVVVCCAVSFFAGFFVSMSPPADSTGGIPHLMRLNKVEESGMAHGESGEDGVSALPFQILSWNPRALYFPNFSNRKQCETVVKMAKGKLKPSTLALRKGETAENTKGIRTSSGTFISSSEDPSGVIGVIEQKIARATMIPRENGEPFNVLRYEIGQRYASHYDAFNAAEYGPQKSQRVASFLLYLTDVEEGGETMFPYENGSNMNSGYDYERCIGLKVKPRQGDGLLFYSLFVNGTIDPKSLHGSCPVIKGEKWVATKWIRDQVHE